MKLEAVTVCIGYADFLAHTVAHNAGLFDRWIIITSADDKETREVCRHHSIQTLLTNDHARDGGFNKGRIVERGLQHLSADGWRMHVDADIILPHRLPQLLRAAHLDEKGIYGCDRAMVRSYEQWQVLKSSGWLSHDYHCCVTPPAGIPIGTRWAHHDGGFVPIGFMQLWHSSQEFYHGARIRPYPTNHNDACRSDVQFALQWDRRDRHLIPELLAIHLESESCGLGANWKGRKTKHFGPTRDDWFCGTPIGKPVS